MQTRRWFITQNNPADYVLTRDSFIAQAKKLHLDYFAFCEEIATTGTRHYHLYTESRSPVYFSRMQKLFPHANIQKANSSGWEIRQYLRKEGSWVDSEKSTTIVPDSFWEEGEVPVSKRKSTSTPKSFQILEAIKSGASDLEIMEAIPGAVYQARNLDALRQAVLREKYGNERRNVTVTVVSKLLYAIASVRGIDAASSTETYRP